MKRCLIVAGLLLSAIWGNGSEGHAVPVTGGLHAGFCVMARMAERAGEAWQAAGGGERVKERKKEEYIAGLLAGMSLEEKLSQMMIFTSAGDMTEERILESQPGGILYFSRDFDGKTIAQVKERTSLLQEKAKYPMFVAVDEEGGAVSRTRGLMEPELPRFLGARQMWEEEDEAGVREDAREKSKLLLAMGLNLNFAPVADVSDRKGAYMHERSAGDDGETVAGYVRTVVAAMQEENMGSCVKHFPGYGNNANTHAVYTEDFRPLSDYRECDFLPFRAGVEQGVDMVMVSHVVMCAVDDKNPASLSPAVHGLLREELGFDGVVLSDDLNMAAIRTGMSLEEASAQAVLAGNDMIFSADYNASLRGLLRAVEEGSLTEKRIDESVARILRMKMERRMIPDVFDSR